MSAWGFCFLVLKLVSVQACDSPDLSENITWLFASAGLPTRQMQSGQKEAGSSQALSTVNVRIGFALSAAWHAVLSTLLAQAKLGHVKKD